MGVSGEDCGRGQAKATLCAAAREEWHQLAMWYDEPLHQTATQPCAVAVCGVLLPLTVWLSRPCRLFRCCLLSAVCCWLSAVLLSDHKLSGSMLPAMFMLEV